MILLLGDAPTNAGRARQRRACALWHASRCLHVRANHAAILCIVLLLVRAVYAR